MDKLLCPSLMCMDFGNLSKEVSALDEAGVDIYHCDIMDGNFVPNFTLGLNDIRAVKHYTDKMIDAHLMIENPLNKVEWFIAAGADIIYIHPEAERFVLKTLAKIRDLGAYAGIAVSPDTSVSSLSEILNLCDYVMVMTVYPGFSGQPLLEFTCKKVKQLAELKGEFGFKLMIDGHCSPQVIEEMSALGADGFVLGTSALFGTGKSYKEIMDELR